MANKNLVINFFYYLIKDINMLTKVKQSSK